FFSSRRRHTRFSRDWSSDVCSSDLLAEMGGVLVTVETGLVGGHFEQHPARRAEIDRPEIIAVDHRRHLITGIHQRLAHLKLLFRSEERRVGKECRSRW